MVVWSFPQVKVGGGSNGRAKAFSTLGLAQTLSLSLSSLHTTPRCGREEKRGAELGHSAFKNLYPTLQCGAFLGACLAKQINYFSLHIVIFVLGFSPESPLAGALLNKSLTPVDAPSPLCYDEFVRPLATSLFSFFPLSLSLSLFIP
jgi:hypothetical protein